ncbi:hypothetical protein D3C71_1992460 [compost metagenome]
MTVASKPIKEPSPRIRLKPAPLPNTRCGSKTLSENPWKPLFHSTAKSSANRLITSKSNATANTFALALTSR